VPFKYQSGEEIKKGDKVLFHGEAGEIDLVAEAPGGEDTKWYVREFGGGVVVKEPKVFGRLLNRPGRREDLILVSRAYE
jgi:hypothetical protein